MPLLSQLLSTAAARDSDRGLAGPDTSCPRCLAGTESFPYIGGVIDTDQKLAEWWPRLRAAEWIALDTEADSLHAYPEKLCLLQLSIPGEDVLVDTLAPLNFTPVLDVLAAHEVILHSADYDLRLLWKRFGFKPGAIFDTMLAARLLGCREFGLNNLLSQFLGVRLEKGSQKANWARRPLTPRMEHYALNDVHYLKALADILRQRLAAQGRVEWHRQACAQLIEDSVAPREEDPDRPWRVKGSHVLDPRGLAILRELWRWREREAVTANKPPYFILPPLKMVEVAAAAATGAEVAPLLPRHLTPRRCAGVLKAVEHGRAVPHPPAVLRHRGQRQTAAERRRLHLLEKRRNQRALELGLDATFIASRATLLLLATDWEKHSRDLMPWQRQLLEAAGGPHEVPRAAQPASSSHSGHLPH